MTIPGGANNDAIVIKNTNPNFYKVIQGELNEKLEENEAREKVDYRHLNDQLIANNFKQKLGELLREALSANLKMKGAEQDQELVKARSFVVSADEETNEEIISLERELAEGKERLGKLMKMLTDPGAAPEKDEKDTAQKDETCKAKGLEGPSSPTDVDAACSPESVSRTRKSSKSLRTDSSNVQDSVASKDDSVNGKDELWSKDE